MKYWDSEQLRADSALPDDICHVAELINDSIAACGIEGPKLVQLGVYDSLDDTHMYEALLELAPGVILPTEFGLIEAEHANMSVDDLEEEEVAAELGLIDWVDEGLRECLPMLDQLADTLHLARLEARRVLAAWELGGVRASLADVRLAPYDHWRGSKEPKILVLIDGFGESLTSEVQEVHVEELGDLSNCMSEMREVLAQRSAKRAALLAMGTTNTISQLALNAIDQFGEREAILRRFAGEWRVRLPDDTTLLMVDGDVTARNGSGEAAIQWGDGWISVDASLLAADKLIDAVGRPVTQLLKHECLSDNMVVTAVLHNNDETLRIALKLDVPCRLFCSISGRVWDRPGSDQNVADVGSHGGSVIPFRKRAG